jgi:hypothetical protein
MGSRRGHFERVFPVSDPEVMAGYLRLFPVARFADALLARWLAEGGSHLTGDRLVGSQSQGILLVRGIEGPMVVMMLMMMMVVTMIMTTTTTTTMR